MDILELPFDQYQRYRLVADVLNDIRPRGKELSLLDVGGRTALLREFLPEDRIQAVDLEASEEPGLVLGDGSRLPFQDDSFDVVAAFDTLEHVPPDRRTAFVNECARVASRWVILIGPYASQRVDEAEERLVDFLREKLKTEHRYLDEHRSHGLPNRQSVESTLSKHGMRTTSIGQGDLDRWLGLMCMELYMDADPYLRPIAKRFFRFYNSALYASDHGEDMYRYAIIGAKGRARLPKKVPGQSPSPAPSEATAAVLDLAQKLLVLDTERDVWEPELARLRGVIEDLEKDLAGHKRRLKDVREDLQGHKEKLDEALEDLAGHQETLVSTRADLKKVRAQAKVQADEFHELEHRAAAQAKALKADLAQHAATLVSTQEELARAMEAVQSEREGFAEERTRQEWARAALAQDLEGHRGALAGREAEVTELRMAMEKHLEATELLEVELRSQVDALTRDRQSLTGELETHRTHSEDIEQDLRGRLKDHEKVREELTAENAALLAHRNELQSDLDLASQALEETQGELAHLRRSLLRRRDNFMRLFRGGSQETLPHGVDRHKEK